jgi:hypothetical protein
VDEPQFRSELTILLKSVSANRGVGFFKVETITQTPNCEALMCNPPSRSFEHRMEDLIDRHDGRLAVETFVQADPEQRYAMLFNECMGSVDARAIEKAYLGPQAVIAAKITTGEVKSFAELLETVSAVLLVTAKHYRVRSYHRANPRMKADKNQQAIDGSERRPLRLFVPLGEADRFAGTESNPTANIELAELKVEVLRGARGLARLPLQAYRRVREYEIDHGTRYGAFRQVARMAVVDSNLRIVKFRRTAEGGPEEPAKAIVRQVRRLFLEAERKVYRVE